MNSISKRIGILLRKGEYMQSLYFCISDRNQVSNGSLIGARYIESICTAPKTGFVQFKTHVIKICQAFSNKNKRILPPNENLKKEGVDISHFIMKEVEKLESVLPKRFSQAQISDIYASYYNTKNKG